MFSVFSPATLRGKGSHDANDKSSSQYGHRGAVVVRVVRDESQSANDDAKRAAMVAIDVGRDG
jgi:hypothetical protein